MNLIGLLSTAAGSGVLIADVVFVVNCDCYIHQSPTPFYLKDGGTKIRLLVVCRTWHDNGVAKAVRLLSAMCKFCLVNRGVTCDERDIGVADGLLSHLKKLQPFLDDLPLEPQQKNGRPWFWPGDCTNFLLARQPQVHIGGVGLMVEVWIDWLDGITTAPGVENLVQLEFLTHGFCGVAKDERHNSVAAEDWMLPLTGRYGVVFVSNRELQAVTEHVGDPKLTESDTDI